MTASAISALFRMGTTSRRLGAMTVLDWLLDADPSIRWQTLRDLRDAPLEVLAAERARVAREGWGARLLITKRFADAALAWPRCRRHR